MFKITKNTKIYVVCPAHNKTGGTELAHQLVYQLNKIKKIAHITYYECPNQPFKINDAFLQYVNNFKKIDEIEDSEENVLIVPEINLNLLTNYKKIQKSAWWMSVDNFVKRDGLFNAIKFYGFFQAIKHVVKGRVNLIKTKINPNYIHFYQSEYAKDFLRKNNIKNSYRLSDYLNDSYLEVFEEVKRLDQVLYNPKKGIEFTKKIISQTPHLKWIPLENLTTNQVKELLKESKVYIDFGNHPGKDRFPREAAICGCCVITGKRGSAKFYGDIPIPEKYKFEDKDSSIENIIFQIEKCISNYDECKKEFDDYRIFISNEHSNFIKDVNQIMQNMEE